MRTALRNRYHFAFVVLLALAAQAAPARRHAATAAAAAVHPRATAVAASKAAAQPPRTPSIVMVVSFGRSGSTFVSSLLASHPLVHFAPGEPWNESCPPEELRVSARCPSSGGGLDHDRSSFCGALRAARANATTTDSVSVLFEALARSNPSPSNTCPSSIAVTNATDTPSGAGGVAATPPSVRGFKVLYSQLWATEPRDPCAVFRAVDARYAYARDARGRGQQRGAVAARALASEERWRPLRFEHVRAPVADGAARYGARVVLLVRSNKLSHYLSLQSAARILRTKSGRLHCARESVACVVPDERMYVQVSCSPGANATRSARALGVASVKSRLAAPARTRPTVCDALPLASAAGGGETRYMSFPWRATLPASPLRCACLSAFIQIATREDELTARGLQARGLAVLAISYESLLLPARDADGMAGAEAICSIFSFLGLACRDEQGQPLVVAGTRRLHDKPAAEQIANVDEVRAYLERHGMRWMLRH